MLLCAPLLLAWNAAERARQSRTSLEVLLPSQARTLSRFAEATIPSGEPDTVWVEVALTVDAYLARFQSPRKWRSVWLWTAIEWIPLTYGRPPFSRMGLEQRRHFCDAHFRTTRGVLGALAAGRQLARMGYYSRPDVQRAIGFTPWEARSIWIET